jgi:hypothetical protein
VPRRRTAVESQFEGDVPVELLSAGHAAWRSVQNTRAWTRKHGLTMGSEIEWGPINRRRRAAVLWAFEAGVTKPPMSNGFVPLDYVRAREMGLLLDGYGDAVREQFRFSGVQFISEDLPGEWKV